MLCASILSFSYAENVVDLREEGILNLISENLNGTEDIVLLPEFCLGPTISELGDSFLSGIAKLAAENNVYIQAAVNRKLTEKSHANSAILFDKDGEAAFIYDKVYPYWSEYDREDSDIIPGNGAVFADTHFGRVSAAICFDANFSNLWQDISDLDVDVVFFSSAYSAGRQLSAHALNHHYAIVTSTLKPDFAVYDIDGREVTYNRCQPQQILVSRTRIDLDRVICHHNFNREKILAMLTDHPGEIELEHDYEREEWCVIRSVTPQTNVRALCRKYGIESLRDYKRRSRAYADNIRNAMQCNAMQRNVIHHTK